MRGMEVGGAKGGGWVGGIPLFELEKRQHISCFLYDLVSIFGIFEN